MDESVFRYNRKSPRLRLRYKHPVEWIFVDSRKSA